MHKNRKNASIYPVSSLQTAITFPFKLLGKDTIPIQSWLKSRGLVQLERITFRAVYLLRKLFFFVALNLILSLRIIPFLIEKA